MPDVLTLGEPLCVFQPIDGETLTRGVGGAELNVAVALARLGRSVTYVSRVGDDPFGEAVVARLRLAGVDVRVAVDPDAPTGIYFRDPATGGGRRVGYYRSGSAASRLGPDDLPALDGYRVVHTTGITAVLSPSARAAVEAAARAPAFTLAVNLRPALARVATYREAILPLLPRVDVLFLSEDDLAVVSGPRALALGAAAVVLTRGPAGAVYLDRAGTEVEARAPVVEAIDTVGAGDAFAAGFLDGWLSGLPPADCLAAGCDLGARTAAHVGDQL